MRRTLFAVAFVFLLFSGGCSPFGCTDAGCESGVQFTLDGLNIDTEYRVTACVDDRCADGTLQVGGGADGTDGPLWLGIGAGADTVFYRLGELPLSGEHRATLAVRTAGGELLVQWEGTAEFVRTQPNGPLCEPTCWLAEITV
ncbi:MAG TPA: hypothetical protein VLA59_02865 [Patescibacteria group bacterium]|nr:hypothetical protein [Patescibacteria group bacterium]